MRVLVKSGDLIHFPTCYFCGEKEPCETTSIESKADSLLSELVKGEYDVTNWVKVDARSKTGRKNPDGRYSLDIGMLAIMDSVDIPIQEEGYEWVVVNLDDSHFPFDLSSDHLSLWQASRDMFEIMK
jgi:hypothetical protein